MFHFIKPFDWNTQQLGAENKLSSMMSRKLIKTSAHSDKARIILSYIQVMSDFGTGEKHRLSAINPVCISQQAAGLLHSCIVKSCMPVLTQSCI